ncbi:MAG: ATP-grasp domain-containing protein [Chloroflexi bacterium]|nr:ATP-grasp domain-containing protein [Chloroflexota bacterium]
MLHVAVTGLNATDDPNPGIAVIQSLRDASGLGDKVRIIGLAYDALDTGIYSGELVDEVYLLPYAAQGEGALLHRLREIRTKTRIDVIIPTLDGEIINFCRLEHVLQSMGIRLLIPTEHRLRTHFKHTLHQFCAANDVPAPKTELLFEAKQLEKAGKTFGYPFVVKGILHGAHLAHTPDQARAYFDTLHATWGIPLLAQEYIPGDERDVAALCDRKGTMVGAVAMRKLGVSERGKAWAAVTIRDQELLDLAARIVEKLNWVGPLEFEFVRHATTSKPYLLEINPRFPAWVYLAARAGQNMPARAVHLALGKRAPAFAPYQEGVVYVRHAKDIVCSMDQVAHLVDHGELVLRKNGRGTGAWPEKTIKKPSTKSLRSSSTP